VFLGLGVVCRDSREDNHNQLGEDLGKYLVVQRGDIVFNKLRTWQGGLGASAYEGIVSPAYFVCRPGPDHDSRFLQYLLLSDAYLQELTRVSKWQPPSQFDIGWEQLRAVPIFFPDLPAQRAIADYLDTETARIDALIDKKQRMVQLLADRHLQMVRELTCCSGLGRPLRRVVSTVKTGTTPRLGVETLDGDAEWVTPGDFAEGLLLLPAARLVPESVVHTGEVPLFPPGSILVVGIGATAGKVAFADRAVSSNQQVTAIVPGPDIEGRFLAWQMWSRASELRDLAPYTTLPILNNEFLRSFPVDVPTLALQREVVRSVDGQWAETQALQLRLNRQTDLLRERRQALITAAVTGELEIPGVAA